VLKNKAMKRIFGQKKNEVTGGWRKLHKEELHNLYYLPIIMRMRWAGNVARIAKKKKKNAYRILLGKPEGKRPLGRYRRRWEDNIMMDFREIEWGLYGLD
jgi:hypothetical protein